LDNAHFLLLLRKQLLSQEGDWGTFFLSLGNYLQKTMEGSLVFMAGDVSDPSIDSVPLNTRYHIAHQEGIKKLGQCIKNLFRQKVTAQA
jgi:hypothetical protein